MAFDVGQEVRMTATFTNSTGGLTSPTTVKLWLKLPTSTDLLGYVYGTDTLIVLDSSGQYHLDYATATAGEYLGTWESTGNLIAVIPFGFTVRTSKIRPLRTETS